MGKKILAIILMMMAVFAFSVPVFAEGGTCGDECVETSIIGGGCYCGGIGGILIGAFNIMSGLVGVLAVLGVIIAGYQYMTSEGDPSKMTKAKSRIVNIVIGLAIYAVFWSVLNFLVPGGLMNAVNQVQDMTDSGFLTQTSEIGFEQGGSAGSF